MAIRNDFGRRCFVAARCCVWVVAAASLPVAGAEQPRSSDGTVKDRPKDGANPYSQLDNKQLDALFGVFEDLDRDQRRWFLTEVRKRMADKGEGPRIRVGDNHRFGRVVHKIGRTGDASGVARRPGGTSPSTETVVEPTKAYGTGTRSNTLKASDAPVPVSPPEDAQNITE